MLIIILNWPSGTNVASNYVGVSAPSAVACVGGVALRAGVRAQ